MALLPLVKTSDQAMTLLQTKWKSILDIITGQSMITAAPMSGKILSDVSIRTGTNEIEHGLGRVQSGWIVTDINNTSVIYRDSRRSFNNRSLVLISDSNCTINLWVF